MNKLTGNGESECATLALETIQSAEVQDLVKKMATYKIGAPKESRWSSQTKLTGLREGGRDGIGCDMCRMCVCVCVCVV